jgi:hypothetical protein
MDGQLSDVSERFRPNIASSLTLFLDHPRPGLPVHIEEQYADCFYPMDGYEEDGQMLLSGFSKEVGVFVDHGMTIEEAAKSCLDKLLHEAVSVPDVHFRTDLGLTGYPNAPLTRYTALNDQWGHSMRMR